MKTTSKIMAGLLLASLAAGCGTDEPAKNVIEEIKNTAREPKLMKTWQATDCKDSELLDASMREYYNFAGNDFTRAIEFYSEGNCQEPLARLRYSGDIKLGDSLPQDEDTRHMDFNYEKVTLEPLKEDGVELLNTAKFCGISDWALNAEREITAQSAEANCPVEDVPKTYYNIVRVEDKSLYLGKSEGDLSNLNERPTELDRENFFQESEHDITD